MQSFGKDFLPPIIVRLFKRSGAKQSVIYTSYAAAALSCQKDAYQAQEIVKVVLEKNIRYRDMLQTQSEIDIGGLRTLIALGLSNKQGTLNVIDFGGGGGYHHTIAKKAFGNDIVMKWNVVETSAMVRESKRMEQAGLKFFDDLDAAKQDLGDIDLVLASGSLQYCPQPLDFLKRLTEVGAKNIFITRTPFQVHAEEVISTQLSRLSDNGPGPLPEGYENKTVSYPITYANKFEVEKILREKYNIQFSLKETDEGFAISGKPIYMSGYFCVQKP